MKRTTEKATKRLIEKMSPPQKRVLRQSPEAPFPVQKRPDQNALAPLEAVKGAAQKQIELLVALPNVAKAESEVKAHLKSSIAA